MESTFRNEDVPCRFGGEEFVVILPGAPLEVAARRAEQLRGKVEALVVRYLEKNLPRITISIGVAVFPEAGENPEALLKAADGALYRAKAEGRNRVELSAYVGERKPIRKTPAASARRASDEPETVDQERSDAVPFLAIAADD
jgi:PleD family two-component response regulator